ncbi:MAG: ABC transporter permease, partial [Microthrixaceae bacterium]
YTPQVAAIYERGLGLGQVVVDREVLSRHVAAPYYSQVLVSVAPGSDAIAVRKALGALEVPAMVVVDRGGYSAGVDAELEVEGWMNRVMAAVFGGFAAIAAVNTLVMVVLDRRREIALLRLSGMTQRQVRATFRWEAAIVAVSGIGLGVTIAWITLSGFARGATGGSPYVPPLQGLAVVAAVGALAFVATAIPSRWILRNDPKTGG